jgi:hypothetical protein
MNYLIAIRRSGARYPNSELYDIEARSGKSSRKAWIGKKAATQEDEKSPQSRILEPLTSF